MADSAQKRADDSKSVTDKTAGKAAEEEALQAEEGTKSDTSKELLMTLEYIGSLHGDLARGHGPRSNTITQLVILQSATSYRRVQSLNWSHR